MKRVLTFGEAMLRLSPPGSFRLEQAGRFEANVGGAELNVAAGLARMGVPAGFLTALPDNPLGRLAAAGIRRAGLSDDLVAWRKDGRMGLYFVEFGACPRPSKVVYDRAGSAVSLLEPGDIEWKKVLKGVAHLHVTGITPALSPGCQKLTGQALAAAREAGLATSFDLNYRARLWSEEKARRALAPMMGVVDHLITTEEDTWKVFKIKGRDYAEVARKLVSKYGFKSVAVTLREDVSVLRNRWTAIAWDGQALFDDKVYDVEIVDRIGAGDAFSAGYIYGLLSGDVSLGVRIGNAMAALKHTIPGDLLYCDAAEVLALAGSEAVSLRIKR